MSEALAGLLAEFHRRRALGEGVSEEEYRARAGEQFEEFRRILAMESELDEGKRGGAGARRLPRHFGPYLLLREIGRGAVGVVYEAIQRSTARTVAVKILRTGLDLHEVALERFRREALACARIEHPSIVEVYEAGVVDGRPCCAMELLQGRSLDVLAREGRLPPLERLVEGFAGVADALHALHGGGIVHRDLKPGNLIFAGNGRLVLADFGLAHVVEMPGLTLSGEALGTPRYMSPEQLLADGTRIDGRSDVYGLGATMYELLGAVPLFDAPDPRALMRKILTARPRPLADVDPEVPRALGDIVMKCVEKRPEQRYADAAALRDDLRAFLSGDAIAGRAPPAWQQGLRRSKRYRLPALVVLLLVAGATLWARTRPAELRVVAVPTARIQVNGIDAGETPALLRLDAGTHRITLHRPGFAMLVRTLSLEPREERTLTAVLLLKSDAPLPEIARELGIELLALDVERERNSGSWGGTVLPVWPRGCVSAEDLDGLRIDTHPDYEPRGRIVFLRGEELIEERRFTPERTITCLPLPPAVAAVLQGGGPVRWGYQPDEAKEPGVFATVTLAKGGELEGRLHEVRERAAQSPEVTRAVLTAHLLHGAGRHLAAYRESVAQLQKYPRERLLWAVRQRSLQALGLADSLPWAEFLAQLPRELAAGD